MAKPSAEAAVRKYIETVDEHYDYLLVDLEGCFDSRLFHECFEKQGTTLRFVPTGAHWANKAEKAIELVKIELSAVFAEFPTLSNELAFKLAIQAVNQRVMSNYKLSRLEIHWGRKNPTVKLDEIPLSALTAAALPPSLADVELFWEAASWKREEKKRKEARMKIRQVLKSLPAKDPVQLGNGDEFLIFHHDPVSKSKSGFRGVFTCLGQVRSLIVGMRGRHIVTAHPSRVLLHKRGPHQLALDVFEQGVLPESRNFAWEETLDQSEVDEFNETLETDAEHNLVQDDTVPVIEEFFMPKLPEMELEAQIADIDMLLDPPEFSPTTSLPALKDVQISLEELPDMEMSLEDNPEVEDLPLASIESVFNDSLPDLSDRQNKLDELLRAALVDEEPADVSMPSDEERRPVELFMPPDEERRRPVEPFVTQKDGDIDEEPVELFMPSNEAEIGDVGHGPNDIDDNLAFEDSDLQFLIDENLNQSTERRKITREEEDFF